MKSLRGTITRIQWIDEEIFTLTVAIPGGEAPAPGQFYQLKSPLKLLRRPISVMSQRPGFVVFAIKIMGEGTRGLASLRPGQGLELLGPLGRGFSVENTKRALLLGGGIGIAPLVALSEHLACPQDVQIGTTGDVVFEEHFPRAEKVTSFSLEGRAMKKGLPTEGVEEALAEGLYDMIYACGPVPMLAAVQKLGEKVGVTTQLLMEEKMACGIGACLGCTQKVVAEEGFRLLRTCKEGPMFYGSEVIFS